MVYYLAYCISIVSMLFACSLGLYRYKGSDAASKILTVLICCTLVIECAAYYLALKYHHNLELYSIFSIVEFNFLCLYFNNVIDVFRKKNIGVYLGISGTVLGILNLIFLQHLNSMNSYFLFLEGFLVIGMCLFAFFRLLLKTDYIQLYKYPHFWFISILVFFWCITFLNWGLYNYINVKLQHAAWKINIALLVINDITYVAIGLVFLLYPKMQKQ
jgi:hypothetical protein